MMPSMILDAASGYSYIYKINVKNCSLSPS